MILFKCDRCGQVISPLVYKIGFEAFTNRDYSTNNPINSPWAHEEDPDFQKDDLSERIYTLHLCRNCIEEISAVILNSDKSKNSEGGGYRPHTAQSRFGNRSLSRWKSQTLMAS